MELLQIGGRTREAWHEYYFLETKIRIESIIELCQEGDISLYEAYPIIADEYILASKYVDTVFEKLDNLDGDIAGATDGEELQRIYERGLFKDILNDALDYYEYIKEILPMLDDLLESKDYQQKRKSKLKLQLIHDGKPLSLGMKKTPPLPEDNEKNGVSSNLESYLFSIFPGFINDYQLLVDKDFLEKGKRCLRWKKSKQSLAEYIQSIKPSDMKRIPWKTIEAVFDEQDLKNSASSNGNPYKGISKDFEEWEKIKNTSASK